MRLKIAISLTGLISLLPMTSFAAIHNISIQSFSFVPAHQTVTQGDTVRWTNLDNFTHTSTSDNGVWNSGNLSQGQSFSFAFVSSGTFPYHCAIHTSMRDTITVVPAYDIEINIGDNFFNPAVIQIDPGQTVRWLNGGAMNHTSTANDGLWDSGTLAPGQFFDFAFPAEGAHHYHCNFHQGMVGTILVGKPDSVAFDIHIIDFAFQPAETSVTVGQNVRWINFGAVPHTTTDTSANYWNSGTLNPGDVFTLHAGQPGVYNYICNFHPAMTGQLTIADTTSGACNYVVGDINGNGATNGIDVTYGVGYFKGGPLPPVDCHTVCPNEPNPFYAAGDVNGNCAFNGIDVTYFVGYLKGGPGLRACPDCPPAR